MAYVPELSEGINETSLRSLLNTLTCESAAVANLARQHQNDPFSRESWLKSLAILIATQRLSGKIVICGVGKSYHISRKLVATLNSLSIQSTLIHATEAIHGDLGVITNKDTVLLVSASGNSEELHRLLPHISPNVPIILLTCNKVSKLASHPQIMSLLLTELPHHLKEENVHGIPAPTISSALALILGDATILALAESIEFDVIERKRLFSKKHPGGSIGQNLRHLNDKIENDDFKYSPESQDFGTRLESRWSSSSHLSLGAVSRSLTDGEVSNRLSSSEVLHLTREELLQLNPNQLYKWIAFYDYLVINNKFIPFSEIQTTLRKTELHENLIEAILNQMTEIQLPGRFE